MLFLFDLWTYKNYKNQTHNNHSHTFPFIGIIVSIVLVVIAMIVFPFCSNTGIIGRIPKYRQQQTQQQIFQHGTIMTTTMKTIQFTRYFLLSSSSSSSLRAPTPTTITTSWLWLLSSFLSPPTFLLSTIPEVSASRELQRLPQPTTRTRTTTIGRIKGKNNKVSFINNNNNNRVFHNNHKYNKQQQQNLFSFTTTTRTSSPSLVTLRYVSFSSMNTIQKKDDTNRSRTTRTIRRGSRQQQQQPLSSSRSISSSSSTNNNSNRMIITSTKSNTIKKINLLLTNRKKRYELRQTIVEGPRIIYDLVRNPQTYPYVQQIMIRNTSSTSTSNNNDDTNTKNKQWNKKGMNDYEQKIQDILNLIRIKEEEKQQQQQQKQEEKDFSITNNDDHDPPDPPPHHHIHVPQIVYATPEVFEHCTDTVTNQGIIAICTIPDHSLKDDDNNEQLTTKNDDDDDVLRTMDRPKMYLLLDGISDPGNMGTLIRSAVGANIERIILLSNTCCDPYNPKSIRSAMGTTFMIPIVVQHHHHLNHHHLDDDEHQNANHSFFETLQTKYHCPSNRIYAATMYEEENENCDLPTKHSDTIIQNIPYYSINWITDKKEMDEKEYKNDTTTTTISTISKTTSTVSFVTSALMIGSEGNGLSSTIRQYVAQGKIQPIYVPMSSNVESLNAAVCGSIIMFEYHKQQLQLQQQQQ